MDHDHGKPKLRLLGAPEEEEKRLELLRGILRCSLSETRVGETMELLLDRFGCFKGILSAPEEELVRSGLSRETARQIVLTRGLARAYLEDDARNMKRIFDTQSACDLMMPRFLGLETEIVTVLLLNGRGQAVYHGVLSEGSISGVPVYLRRLLELCIRFDSQNVFLAHNHPSGTAAPSRNDLVSTQQIEMALSVIEARLEDHIIFAGRDFYSFQRSGMLDVERRENRECWKNALEDARRRERELIGEGDDRDGF